MKSKTFLMIWAVSRKKMLQNDYLKSFAHLHFIPEENVQSIIMNWDRESRIA